MSMKTMTTIEIPQDVLDSARITTDDLKLEIALRLYADGRLSIGKARELAGMTLWEFRQALAMQKIPVHYDVEDLEADISTLKKVGTL